MFSIKAKLQESNPDRVEKFMAEAQVAVKGVVGNIKNYQVFTKLSSADSFNGLHSLFSVGCTFSVMTKTRKQQTVIYVTLNIWLDFI